MRYDFCSWFPLNWTMPQLSLFTNGPGLDTSELYHLRHAEGAANSLNCWQTSPLGCAFTQLVSLAFFFLFFSPLPPVFFCFLDSDTSISIIYRFTTKVMRRELWKKIPLLVSFQAILLGAINILKNVMLNQSFPRSYYLPISTHYFPIPRHCARGYKHETVPSFLHGG